MTTHKKIWVEPKITAIEQMNAAKVAGYPMGIPKTSSVDSEGVYQGGNS